LPKARHSAWVRLENLPDLDSDELRQVRAKYKLRSPSPELWLTCRDILDEYSEPITLRQLYYQCVSRGYITNCAKSYDNLDSQLTKAREEDFLDWHAFVDRSRSITACAYAEDDLGNPERRAHSQIREAFYSYTHKTSQWRGQPWTLEVWTEKDALAGIIEPVCNRYSVRLVVSRGYTSFTFRREAERRLDNGRRAKILYLGDLDPSGVDIPRVLRDDLPKIELERLALLPEHVTDLPPNPVKDDDPRTTSFLQQYPELEGTCYELDALSPEQIRGLVREGIERHIDPVARQERKEYEEAWNGAYREELDRLRQKLDLDALIDD